MDLGIHLADTGAGLSSRHTRSENDFQLGDGTVALPPGNFGPRSLERLRGVVLDQNGTMQRPEGRI